MDDRGVTRIYRVLDTRSEKPLESTGKIQELMARGRDSGAPWQTRSGETPRQRLDDRVGGEYC